MTPMDHENELMANNLRRIDRLSRRGLLLFLDIETSKSSTVRLRAEARRFAIVRDGLAIDLDLVRAEFNSSN